jgi:hypothetical protein
LQAHFLHSRGHSKKKKEKRKRKRLGIGKRLAGIGDNVQFPEGGLNQ